MEYIVEHRFTPGKGTVRVIRLWCQVVGASDDEFSRKISIRMPGTQPEHKEAWVATSSLPTDKQTRTNSRDESIVPWLGTFYGWFLYTEVDMKICPTHMYRDGDIYQIFLRQEYAPAR
jgi:hypothetical protein